MSVRTSLLSGDVPVLVLGEASLGPTVAVTANLHGDETVGVGVVHELAARLERLPLHGMIWMLPSLNPGGLEAGSRRVPEDQADLNRCFPGDESGTPSEKRARAIWTALVDLRPELVVDIHADCAGHLPYVILDHAVALHGAPASEMARRLDRFGQATGLTVVRDHAPRQYRALKLDRSLSGALVNVARVPALTLEVGPRRFAEPAAVLTGVRALIGLFAEIGVLDTPSLEVAFLAGRPSDWPGFGLSSHPTRLPGGPWRREPGPCTKGEGLLFPMVLPGTRVVTGDILAELRSLSGEIKERLVATTPGFVLGLVEVSSVRAGTPCMVLAIAE
jgi:uncharacterized protein